MGVENESDHVFGFSLKSFENDLADQLLDHVEIRHDRISLEGELPIQLSVSFRIEKEYLESKGLDEMLNYITFTKIGECTLTEDEYAALLTDSKTKTEFERDLKGILKTSMV